MLRPEVLPHRYPFLFIDRIERIVPGEAGTFTAHWSADGFFSADRAPSSLRQFLLLEMMAQAAGIVLISRHPLEKVERGHQGFLLKMDRVLFFSLPGAGDRLVITVEKTHSLGKLHRFSGEVGVGNTRLAGGELTLWQDEESVTI